MQTLKDVDQNTKQAVIFIAHGFDEMYVIDFYCQQRQQGCAVQIVGNQVGEISGRYGLVLPTDATLSSYLTTVDSDCTAPICIPGDLRCASALLSDPRILRLIRDGIRPIYAAPVAKQILQEIGLL